MPAASTNNAAATRSRERTGRDLQRVLCSVALLRLDQLGGLLPSRMEPGDRCRSGRTLMVSHYQRGQTRFRAFTSRTPPIGTPALTPNP